MPHVGRCGGKWGNGAFVAVLSARAQTWRDLGAGGGGLHQSRNVIPQRLVNKSVVSSGPGEARTADGSFRLLRERVGLGDGH